MRADLIKQIAADCGFELSGIAPPAPPADFSRYETWISQGHAGEMRYLTDRRAALRKDVRTLLPTARSIICVGKLYNHIPEPGDAKISRYAAGPDYHHTMRQSLTTLAEKLLQHEPFDYKICVDTAPLLERTYARQAGLGWIGKNTCLINEPKGSWFFLGELITSLELTPDSPPPDRCGTCTRCIESCPTNAFVPAEGSWAIDSRLCISYFTIELRGPIPEEHRESIGPNIFGCDICQEVCPWNTRAPVIDSPVPTPASLEALASLTEPEFSQTFRDTAIARPKYTGFLRNVAIAMGNSKNPNFTEPLEALAKNPDPIISDHARWAIEKRIATIPIPIQYHKERRNGRAV